MFPWKSAHAVTDAINGLAWRYLNDEYLTMDDLRPLGGGYGGFGNEMPAGKKPTYLPNMPGCQYHLHPGEAAPAAYWGGFLKACKNALNKMHIAPVPALVNTASVSAAISGSGEYGKVQSVIKDAVSRVRIVLRTGTADEWGIPDMQLDAGYYGQRNQTANKEGDYRGIYHRGHIYFNRPEPFLVVNSSAETFFAGQFPDYEDSYSSAMNYQWLEVNIPDDPAGEYIAYISHIRTDYWEPEDPVHEDVYWYRLERESHPWNPDTYTTLPRTIRGDVDGEVLVLVKRTEPGGLTGGVQGQTIFYQSDGIGLGDHLYRIGKLSSRPKFSLGVHPESNTIFPSAGNRTGDISGEIITTGNESKVAFLVDFAVEGGFRFHP